MKDVVVCPQQEGRPLVAVFERFGKKEVDEVPRRGNVMLFNPDGTYAWPQPRWADGYFEDLNADTVVDFVVWGRTQIGREYTEHIEIIPVTGALQPSFRLHWLNGAYEWSIEREHEAHPTRIVLTDAKPPHSVVAAYVWSQSAGRWDGPSGSVAQGFLVQAEGMESPERQLLPGAGDCESTIDEVARALPPIRKMFAQAAPEDQPGVMGGWMEERVSFSYGFLLPERFETRFYVDYSAGALEVRDALSTDRVPVPRALRDQVKRVCEREAGASP